MLYRLSMLLIAGMLIWMGYICVQADRFGPMFTGWALIILGGLIVVITLLCWWEHIVNIILIPFTEPTDYD